MRVLSSGFLLLLSDAVPTAVAVASPQSICARVMLGDGKGEAVQDWASGGESRLACLKNLYMFWWPDELPAWTREQWCKETALNEITTSGPGVIPNVARKTVLVTGGDTGLGFATMKALAESGADVSYTSRNCNCHANAYSSQWPHQCEELESLRAAVQQQFGHQLKCYNLDLLKGESLAQFVRDAQQDFSSTGLSTLVNNAGLVDDRSFFGNIFNANFLGTFAVTKGLWSLLQRSARDGNDVRIITTSSVERLVLNEDMTRKALDAWNDDDYYRSLYNAQLSLSSAVADVSTLAIPIGYSFSKLADLMFALRLQDLIKESAGVKHITVFATHPGATHTLMTRNMDVGQMTRDQGVLPNLLAISQPVASFAADYPNFIGPALNRYEAEHYIELDAQKDDSLKQYQLAQLVNAQKLGDSEPVDAVSCLEMVGAPMQYPKLRMVERAADLQEKLWQIAESGLNQVYSSAWQNLNLSWTGLVTHPAASGSRGRFELV